MADAFDPSPRRTRSRSRINSDSADHPRRRTRSRTVSRLSPHDPQPDPGVRALQTTAAREISAPALIEKRPRHKMTNYQLKRLEELYRADTHPSRGAKEALAADIGMNVKSVLIWFQNRRQDRSKKAKAITTPALTRHVHPSSLKAKHIDVSMHAPTPLGRNAETRVDTAARGKHPTSLLTSSRAGSLQEENAPAIPQVSHQTPLLEDAYSHLRQPLGRPLRSISFNTPQSEKRSPDLWKHLPPTPPSRSRKPSQFLSRSPSHHGSPVEPLGDASNTACVAAGRPEKPTLEWACANSAARRKHGLAIYRDEDDSAGESSDPEDKLTVTRWIPPRQTSRTEASSLGNSKDAHKIPKERRVFREIAIPDEYHALFSPDLVLGASLLLTLKHSADDMI